ncbi:hydantoinase/oxoprolinase family protein [Hansschlegelia quercus]|uniref:S-layer protein n=1 Tax=Hansschlegelia quercus TaxID=2528245 RepID=A0A4Q9GRX7_9HYPH|nr:hydantoinase/oxoprolinase family protein [Hansschlegelia quercus]TBN54527.1 S-layer protein [Hansschlegelia quercus]
MSNRPIVGLDVGGAHLKLALLSAEGRLEAVWIAPCALWKGLDRLGGALDELLPGVPEDARFAATMTGELVDLWPDRAAGVAAIAEALAQRLGPVSFYGGEKGFSESAEDWRSLASANWRATAEALAATEGAGLLVDIGSTTADLVPFAKGRLSARGSDDAGRMATDELVYLGIARTPVMALAARMPFNGAWVSPMAEHFATTADVFRLTGDLPEGADLHEAADGGEKTVEASARRLLRMVGADFDAETALAARALARFLSEVALRRFCDAAAVILARSGSAAAPVIYGAGVGRFLARRLAERLGLMYRDVGTLWADDLADAVSSCAPAVAVARLFRSRTL